MTDNGLPQNVRRLGKSEAFRFSCHPGVVCFTECCRQLDLALTAYDVLRLCRGLNISAADFLDRYAVIEKSEEDAFPTVFLAMVDNNRADCPFVTDKGCSVYRDRPGPCRTYPVGRGSYRDEEGQLAEIFVLLNEPHCRGFEEGPEITVNDWVADQELAVYNEMNDLLVPLLHHRRIREGLRPTKRRQQRYLEILYGLDNFRRERGLSEELSDKELFKTAIGFLQDELFI